MREHSGNGAFPWFKGAVLLLLLVCLGILVLRLIPAEWLEQEYLDRRLQQAGALAPLVFMLVKALVVVTIVPVAPLDVAAGALFGPLEGSIYSALVSYGAGLTNISFSAYAISTFLGMAPITIALNYYGRSFMSGNLALQIVLGLVLVVLMFLVPIWIKRRNPWGLYEKMKGEKERGD